MIMTALELLKLDLGIISAERDEYFTNLLCACEKELNDKGIICEDTDTIMLLSDLAAYRYRNRTSDNAGLSKSLHYRILNLQMKGRAANG